jgi:hypothetical protein
LKEYGKENKNEKKKQERNKKREELNYWKE